MRFVIVFLFGAACGVAGLYLYQEQDRGIVTASASDVGQRVKDSAAGARDAISEKLVEWRLTPEEIRQDLSKTGKVVRSTAAVAGERISDARIVAIVKAKYVLDRDLSALDINVDCRDGDVSLRGAVGTPVLVGRAMALALETTGVRTVTSQLSVTAAR